MNGTFIKGTICVTLMRCTNTKFKIKIVLHIKSLLSIKSSFEQKVFNPDLKMPTVLLLHREEGILFQRSGATLLNTIPPKVTIHLWNNKQIVIVPARSTVRSFI